jgi:exodeoxyribonuclease VII large subunit
MHYLAVAFKGYDAVKRLGACWDADARSWYVPAGVDLAPFAQWLPAGAVVEAEVQGRAVAPSQASESTAVATDKGVSLSRLMQGVSAAVAAAFADGVWVRAEVVNVTLRGGHVYLELSDRTPAGDVLATAKAVIFQRNADRILPAFQTATGSNLAPGLKVLLLSTITIRDGVACGSDRAA